MDRNPLLKAAGKPPRWRPPVAAPRRFRMPRLRGRRPLPGQRYLPGMAPPPICPNCGGREFDEDGDCTGCWEPYVVVGR